MSRTEKFFKNSITTALYQIVVMIAGFITPRIMLSYYGSEINGLVTSVSQFISYFNLVEAGLASAAAYALYKPLAEKDNGEISAIVSASRRFYNISGGLFFALTIILSLIYPIFVKADALSPTLVALLVLVIGASGALEFLTMSRYRVLLSADQRTYILSLATIAAVVINTAVIAVLSSFGANIVLVRLVALSSVFLRSGILMLYVKKNYKSVDYYAKPNNKALSKRWDALILQILGTIQVGAPVVIATACCSLELVSVYTVFYMVINGINGILSIFQSGLARFRRGYCKGRERNPKTILYRF
jgi:O-antigen/teichoic acid export membrane protein